MKTLFRFVRWLLLAAFLLASALVLHTIYAKPLRIGWFYERVFIEYAVDDPEMLTSLGILPSWMNWYSDDLTDRSLAREEKTRAKLRNDLATLRSYDRAALDESGQLSYDVLEYFLSIQADGSRTGTHGDQGPDASSARDHGQLLPPDLHIMAQVGASARSGTLPSASTAAAYWTWPDNWAGSSSATHSSADPGSSRSPAGHTRPRLPARSDYAR